jgi:hypothetical protein
MEPVHKKERRSRFYDSTGISKFLDKSGHISSNAVAFVTDLLLGMLLS